MTFIEDNLRSTTPVDQLTGVRQLPGMVRSGHASAVPAVVAGVDLAASERSEGAHRKDLVFELRLSWADLPTSAHQEVAEAWWRAVLDVLVAGPSDRRARLLRAWGRSAGTSPWFETRVRRDGPALLETARALAQDPQTLPDAARLATFLAGLVGRQEADAEVRTGIADLSPLVYPADPDGHLSFGEHVYRARWLHPQPEIPLAALIDRAVREVDRQPEVGKILLTETGLDLRRLRSELRAWAEQWGPDELDRIAETLFDTVPDLELVLRRASGRRAIAELFVERGPVTPAMARLAEVVARAGRKPAPSAPSAPADPGVEFVDANLRLAVINELMYEREVLTPRFDGAEFIATYPHREIDPAAGPVPEILAHFASLPLTAEHLAAVTELSIEASDSIYFEIYRYWDGETDEFAVASFVDVRHLPNLREISDEAMTTPDVDLTPLTDRGIEV